MWEEMGLLYSSDELNEKERQTFSAHIGECSECAHEWENYQYEQEHFFSINILGDTPSAACDTEILRVCADGRKRVTNLHAIPLFFKKSAISLALFLVGFTVVGYIVFRADVSDLPKTTAGIVNDNKTQPTSATPVSETAINGRNDSLADSAQKNPLNYANQRGNLDLKGVYPVNSENK